MRRWRYWNETAFRENMQLPPNAPTPHFTILSEEGQPIAIVEVSEFAIKKEDVESVLQLIRQLVRFTEFRFPKKRFYAKFYKEAHQLKRVLDCLNGKYPSPLPTLIVLYDPMGNVVDSADRLMRELLGLALTYEIDPSNEGKAVAKGLEPISEGILYQQQNQHISAVALLEQKKVLAVVSGYEDEIENLEYRDFSDLVRKTAHITKKYYGNGINIELTAPVLNIFCNPSAAIPWNMELHGPYDRVWGAKEGSYGLLYDGLVYLYAGTVQGVSLPPPEQMSRASGFYDK